VRFETELADALYVSWPVPAAALPAPPEPLVLDTALDGQTPLAFVTLVLFRQVGLRRPLLPWVRLSFPQCNLRLPVRDQERCASVLVLRELVPAWVVPLARAVGRQPARAAMLRYPERPGADPERWEVLAGRTLSFVARAGAPAAGGPLGGWPEQVHFLRDRRRAYVLREGRLRRSEATLDGGEALPMRVEMESVDWLSAQLPAVAPAAWAAPGCAFLVPSTRLAFEVQPVLPERATARLPAPSLPG